MTWKEFEDYVIAVLSGYYENYGLKVHKTPYVNDGGKDGYGSFLIVPETLSGLGQLFSHEIRFWAEVKKRSKNKANEGDIGGHVILALDNHVHKLIFITNSSFTERAKKACTNVGRRLNMSVSFIDGPALISLSNERNALASKEIVKYKALMKGSNEIKDYARLITGFISNREQEFVYDGIFNVDPGEIIYWVCEISGRYSKGIASLEPILKNNLESPLKLCCLSKQLSPIDATETSQRVVYGVWGMYAGEYTCRDILQEIRCDPDISFNHQSTNTMMKVRSSILADIISDERQALIESVFKDFGILKKNGGVRGTLIEANGGIGKTFLINRVRQKLLPEGLCELYLDGAKHRVGTSVIEALLQQSFPLPVDISESLDPDTLQTWIETDFPDGSNCGSHASNLLSAVNGNLRTQSDISYTVTALISALAKLSTTNPILLIFEDLHKVNASAIELLERIISQLSIRKQGHIYFLFTTRLISENNGDVDEGRWIQAIRSIITNQMGFQHYHLKSFEREDAIELLQKSLNELSVAEAILILEQIGTNPFYIKEALLYLRSLHVIETAPDLGAYVADSMGLRKAIDTGSLQTATRRRLEILIEKHGVQFRDFLISCACLGKYFSIEMALSGCTLSSDFDLIKLLSLCEDQDVFRSSGLIQSIGSEDCAFDHDIVRSAVLGKAGTSGIKSISKNLINKLSWTQGTTLFFRLTYLAGAADTPCVRIDVASIEITLGALR
jgi:hypothetical protein